MENIVSQDGEYSREAGEIKNEKLSESLVQGKSSKQVNTFQSI